VSPNALRLQLSGGLERSSGGIVLQPPLPAAATGVSRHGRAIEAADSPAWTITSSPQRCVELPALRERTIDSLRLPSRSNAGVRYGIGGANNGMGKPRLILWSGALRPASGSARPLKSRGDISPSGERPRTVELLVGRDQDQAPIRACAASIRSNRSRWCRGRSPASAACADGFRKPGVRGRESVPGPDRGISRRSPDGRRSIPTSHGTFLSLSTAFALGGASTVPADLDHRRRHHTSPDQSGAARISPKTSIHGGSVGEISFHSAPYRE